jgi:hypothetical protein
VSTPSATNTVTRKYTNKTQEGHLLTRFLAATGNTSYKEDDFLKLNPSLGQTTSTGAAGASSGTTGESSIPIVPMNPDSSTMGSGHSASTGITDKAGVTDKVWKPTELDEVKTSGAPGAGPAAPDYKAAIPNTNLTASEPAKDSVAPKKETAGVEASTLTLQRPKSLLAAQLRRSSTRAPHRRTSTPLPTARSTTLTPR